MGWCWFIRRFVHQMLWPMSKIFASISHGKCCWAKCLMNTWRLREIPILDGLIFEEVYDSIALCHLCLHICLIFILLGVYSFVALSLLRSVPIKQIIFGEAAKHKQLGAICILTSDRLWLFVAMPFMPLITIVFVWSVVCSFVHIQHNPLQRTQNKWHKV